MSFELKPRVTSEEYLALERKAERKSEYFNGGKYLRCRERAHNMFSL